MGLIETYKSLCSEYYDLDKPHAPSNALEFYLKEARKSTGPVLEMMCGSGRFLLPILKNRIEVDGVDTSEEMLKRCKLKCLRENLKPNLYLEKIQDFDIQKSYNLIFITSGSFGLPYTSQDIQRSLQRLNDHLSWEGLLIFEVETPIASNGTNSENYHYMMRNGYSIIALTTRSYYNQRNNINTHECFYELIENGITKSKESEVIKVKHWEIPEITSLLENQGFSNIEALQPYTPLAASNADSTILLKCMKA